MSSDLFPDLFSTKFESRSTEPSSGIPAGPGPLAHRMRPKTLDVFFGQEHVLAQGKPLRRWIESGRIPSLLFWGPPGCGKTSLACLISQKIHAEFKTTSAVLSGTKELREIVEQAKRTRSLSGRETLLFVDEIHRFNKAQQDALLPHVEDGTVTLIGATTENPSFEVNNALLSRMRVIRLNPLSVEAITQALERALQEPTDGLGGLIQIAPEGLRWISETADGDVRRALTSLEAVHRYYQRTTVPLTLEQIKVAMDSDLGRHPITYDKNGEEHYNVISAFIKSIRDSDPHAGLYYLARMLEGGEDPLFIARRLVILASEDIGNADPRAISIAVAVKEAVEFVGMPEARINLAQGVTYLSMAPKSNASYVGIDEAIEEVRRSGALPVPGHLRNAVTSLMRREGYGKGYQYAHSDAKGQIKQIHLPKQILGKRFYVPKEVGFEKILKEKLDGLNSNFEESN